MLPCTAEATAGLVGVLPYRRLELPANRRRALIDDVMGAALPSMSYIVGVRLASLTPPTMSNDKVLWRAFVLMLTAGLSSIQAKSYDR